MKLSERLQDAFILAILAAFLGGQPVATVSLAVLVLGERITMPFLIGGILAIIGARLAVKK